MLRKTLNKIPDPVYIGGNALSTYLLEKKLEQKEVNPFLNVGLSFVLPVTITKFALPEKFYPIAIGGGIATVIWMIGKGFGFGIGTGKEGEGNGKENGKVSISSVGLYQIIPVNDKVFYFRIIKDESELDTGKVGEDFILRTWDNLENILAEAKKSQSRINVTMTDNVENKAELQIFVQEREKKFVEGGGYIFSWSNIDFEIPEDLPSGGELIFQFIFTEHDRIYLRKTTWRDEDKFKNFKEQSEFIGQSMDGWQTAQERIESLLKLKSIGFRPKIVINEANCADYMAQNVEKFNKELRDKGDWPLPVRSFPTLTQGLTP